MPKRFKRESDGESLKTLGKSRTEFFCVQLDCGSSTESTDYNFLYPNEIYSYVDGLMNFLVSGRILSSSFSEIYVKRWEEKRSKIQGNFFPEIFKSNDRLETIYNRRR